MTTPTFFTAVALLLVAAQIASAGDRDDWQHYGGGPGGSRDSSLTQINRGNVGGLQLAWTYRTGLYEPPSLDGTLLIASANNWGGAAWDPQRQLLVLPVTQAPIFTRLKRTADVTPEELNKPRLGPIGPTITAGGLVFIGASADEKFRAFDVETGAKLWEVATPASALATPMTYAVDGRQFVVVAYALPR